VERADRPASHGRWDSRGLVSPLCRGKHGKIIYRGAETVHRPHTVLETEHRVIDVAVALLIKEVEGRRCDLIRGRKAENGLWFIGRKTC
jgi:hypothetical protein